MSKVTLKNDNNLPRNIIIAVLAVILAILTGVGVNVAIQTNEQGQLEATVEYGTEENATITVGEPGGRGSYEETVTEIDGEDIPTVESVESNGPVTDVNAPECPEGVECGRGAAFGVDITSPETFRNSTLGRCINTDGYYGAQCWDIIDAFWIDYTGRGFNTCGTGAAKGTIADGCWQQNAGSEFTMIFNPYDLRAGDIVVFNTGEWGHVGMAQGSYNNGHITLLGQNQGGGYCEGGGAAANLINISLRDFAGAFRPNIYIPPAPTPTPEYEQNDENRSHSDEDVNKCERWEVQEGDTLGDIMLECRGEIEWGDAMDKYAQGWYSTVFQEYPTVYDGWASTGGYGLFAGDVIEFRGANK